MQINRRTFLKLSGFSFLSLFASNIEAKEPESESAPSLENSDSIGVLVDTDVCIGCRKCEWACNHEHKLAPETIFDETDHSIFNTHRRPDAESYTVVNSYSTGDSEKFIKVQCMHCNEPACASACIVGALKKTPEGAVHYDADKCLGCRYCMIACPFEIPAYEYHNVLEPKVMKCTFCAERTKASGAQPACVELCPNEALNYGTREELIHFAHQRIKTHPHKYAPEIYGQDETGGTSWMYLIAKGGQAIDLPKLPDTPVQEKTEKLQHSLFKSFFPPLALVGILGIAMTSLKEKRNSPSKKPAPPLTPHTITTPFFTTGTKIISAIALVGMLTYLSRFIFGLGATTNLDTAYPWGIWISIDVATGVALAAGGFTTAALVRIFSNYNYYVFTRPALLTALLGYTFVVIGLLADLGRYYNLWHPLLPSMWQGNSVLFEVGICVMIYLHILYIEFLPIVAEKFKDGIQLNGIFAVCNKPMNLCIQLSEKYLHRYMFIFIIAGVVLSCFHQSSLGSLMSVAPTKMHPLWHTPISPLLFLLSAISVGFPVVIFESILSAKSFKLPIETTALSSLAKFIPVFTSLYLAFKIGDLILRDAVRYAFDGSLQASFFLLEVSIGIIIPTGILLYKKWRTTIAGLFTASSLIIFGIILNRINVFLIAYKPTFFNTPYFPSLFEVLVSVGHICTIVLIYRAIVMFFPVLHKPTSSLTTKGEDV